jgi:hypothetical protein
MMNFVPEKSTSRQKSAIDQRFLSPRVKTAASCSTRTSSEYPQLLLTVLDRQS